MDGLHGLFSFQDIQTFTPKAQYNNCFANYTVTERQKGCGDITLFHYTQPVATAKLTDRPAGRVGREEE